MISLHQAWTLCVTESQLYNPPQRNAYLLTHEKLGLNDDFFAMGRVEGVHTAGYYCIRRMGEQVSATATQVSPTFHLVSII